ncbi:kinase-like domain-containing protein [Rhizophagus irregularis DAOM 181602=DAOM 197198]|uniref:Kinase-like domain-containing protein n=1 Tax=Rhizophagus irregularis (strain DAOM 181602 / DAOM 197198 / MUCL 43194) TaxID=747089 RepID=A0A2P4Q8N1_RHIID|nr:kinase-like domain-containing protein [Rhizophagus irregularis DAOM 181602=DAOM 197198]POG74000.1 kinase-like domain-containing protein [Rhizophagus irregularis DAOM 181602=DAOM 197198]|eukprot:XP_025180866.1 kinase-like domain-containing protein [Rhizophagus irregularis DAOM 181602=DAOM 197198]
MELVKLNDENSFDPTPKLKSSPVPIFFVSFNWKDKNCFHCGEEYTEMTIYDQRYCKKCLSSYLTNITDTNNIYLDVHLFTKELECNKHEISSTKVPQNIQECCKNCLTILCFKQISDYHFDRDVDSDSYILYKNLIESEKYCKLCGKLLYNETDTKFISIIYLPWWDDVSQCYYCNEELVFTSNCQKYCMYCIIFFIGCRYCLTTNMIFGYTNQSQCKKCKRISTITIDIRKIFSGNSVLDDFLLSTRSYQSAITKFADKAKNIDKLFGSLTICDSLKHDIVTDKFMNYIPYSQFTNVKELAEGGFSIVYQATWLDGPKYSGEIAILKIFKNSQDISKYFLNELKSNYHCYDIDLIKTYGFTKDPQLDIYILVMDYAPEGDLHKYLQKNFREIKWKDKLNFLEIIINGLYNIHEENFIHRDFHSGNVLVNSSKDCKVGDLGLSRPANDNSSDNEIYGVIPYIAPEIFKGSAFSKESDIYSLGMIMWELTTGCKPFANFEHDHSLIYKIIDGVRPEITKDTSECYADLMKSCWDPDPKKRPSINEIDDISDKWLQSKSKSDQSFKNQFDQAELIRKELIDSKKFGPEFSEKLHPKAIYTSRSLNSYISKCSSIFSKCSSINFTSNDYISEELKLDIDIESSGLNSTWN